MKDRALYSITEARELLGGICRNTIYGLLRDGELESVVIGRRRFISAAAISDLIAKSTIRRNPPEHAQDGKTWPPLPRGTPGNARP
jgi:excisionase family DNA binding protein